MTLRQRASEPVLDRPAAVRRRTCLGLAVLGLPWLGGCHFQLADPIRLAAHPWPGYELLYLARELDRLDEEQVRLIETGSATASMRLLASSSVEGAGLTLDEVLTARSRGMDLTIVAVLDASLGADVLMARPGIRQLADLRGRSIGVEQTAVGAVMLDAALQAAGLRTDQIRIRYLPVDAHEAAYRAGQVDALVTYEPVRTRLRAAGAHTLFSSAAIPGRIFDVLAVRSTVAQEDRESVQAAVDAHFLALQAWRREPEAQSPRLAPRLGIEPAQVTGAFAELELPDRAANRALLQGPRPALLGPARRLVDLMLRADLLPGPLSLDGLFNADFVR